MDIQQALAVIAEPTRFRIVRLLAEAPRTVGEVAATLGALQPQTTKHLQALEAAGVVRIHRLGRRRVARLDREALRGLAEWFGALAVSANDEDALERYEGAIARAEARAAEGELREVTIELSRDLPAPAPVIWSAWTDPVVASRWWSPSYFEVVECSMDAVPGGRVSLTLREPDGVQYRSVGRVREAESGRRLVYDLSPVGDDGNPLFEVVHEVVLEAGRSAGMTAVRLTIRAAGGDLRTAAMIAGLEPGWGQLLDGLERVLIADMSHDRPSG
ncbi:metalloregulator ArsR/SmtB family transcription factor [Leifsonia sp. LS-T14]|uniref:metalloregulator ArsR/SmtB family transcription factor n=1 Tax=unclassified Leifsonia TaxID=2663824 RepID=UPI0035A5F6D6